MPTLQFLCINITYALLPITLNSLSILLLLIHYHTVNFYMWRQIHMGYPRAEGDSDPK